MLSSRRIVERTGLDGIALKPLEVDLGALSSVPVDALTVDFEGVGALPSRTTLERLTELASLRVTVPVRADGFDPLGDDRRWSDIPPDANVALVAGNPAYLTATERRRRIAPRLSAALDRATDPWVGTESIERLARATGSTQFMLLGPDTERRVAELGSAGFDGAVAVYAPTVLADDADAVLDALGAYVARRRPVAGALRPDAPTDASASGAAREVLLDACEAYAAVGDLEAVRGRVESLRKAGADHVVAYPPRGLDEFGVDG